MKELFPNEVEVGMKVKIKGHYKLNEDIYYTVDKLYEWCVVEDVGFDVRSECSEDSGVVAHADFMSGRVKVYLIEDIGNPKYDRTIYGKYDTGVCTIDVYDVLTAFNVTNPQLQHAVKKCLAVGQRGHKNTREDLVDILHSVQSALDAFDKMNKN